MLKVLAQVGRWLSLVDLDVADLSVARLESFRVYRRQAGFRQVPGSRALRPLLSYLTEIGVVQTPVPVVGPLEVLLTQYRDWLVIDRGLAEGTVLRYETTARLFLEQRDREGVKPAALTGAHVNHFLLAECGRVSAGSAKGRVAELRSLLRYLFIRQITPFRLGTAVPPVGGWRLTTVPPVMTRDDVQALLDHCDRDSEVGVRDLAMLTLIARLGLRSIEVARLELGDINWRTGEVFVRGKGRQEGRMPLPIEVGEAITTYLVQRPASDERRLFLTNKAPHQSIRAALVNDVTERACKRAGLPRVGPHRLRHALAAELLRQGADLVAIGQVLRHRDLATTALYAKVDLESLRSVAQPWPGINR
jgi:site-specific recombinase XerD